MSTLCEITEGMPLRLVQGDKVVDGERLIRVKLTRDDGRIALCHSAFNTVELRREDAVELLEALEIFLENNRNG